MIGCPCGGFTSTHRAKAGAAELRWQECGSCGRAGAFLLTVGNRSICSEETARRIWNDPPTLAHITARHTHSGKPPNASPGNLQLF